MSDAIDSKTNNLPVDAMNIMAMLFDKRNIVNSYKLVANGHGFSFTLQLNQTNKEQPSALSTPRTMGSYKSPSSRSRDQRRYMQYQQQHDMSPQHDADHFDNNNMKDNTIVEKQVDADDQNTVEICEKVNNDKHDTQNVDHIEIITSNPCEDTPGASTDVDRDSDHRQDDEESTENNGPPKNKVYPGILTARTVLFDAKHSQEFRKRITDDTRNKTFSKIVKDKNCGDDVLIGISDDLIVESHADKTFDHFIILEEDDKTKSKKYANIVEAIHKEPPVDEDCCTESMNWLQFLLPNLIKQHQKCIRLMDLGTLET